MTRNFTEGANAIVVQAYEHAIRLGHPYLGGEHLLLALATVGQPAGAVLREHGVTPERAEAEIVRLSGGGLLGDLARDARAAHWKPRWFNTRPAGFNGRDGAYLPLGPAARRGRGTPPSPPMSRTSRWASSPSARDWCLRSCQHSACPARP